MRSNTQWSGPGATAERATEPQPWKIAILTWLALLPQVVVLGLVIPADWPFPVAVTLSTAIPVAVLTWVAMPRLTRRLSGWLGQPRPRTRTTP